MSPVTQRALAEVQACLVAPAASDWIDLALAALAEAGVEPGALRRIERDAYKALPDAGECLTHDVCGGPCGRIYAIAEMRPDPYGGPRICKACFIAEHPAFAPKSKEHP